MTDLIERDLTDVAVMIAAGMGIMLIFFSMEKISLMFRSIRMEKFCYLLTWIIAAEFFSECLYRCSYGKITMHTLLSAAIGIILWKKIIYVIIPKRYGNEKAKGKWSEKPQKEKKS